MGTECECGEKEVIRRLLRFQLDALWALYYVALVKVSLMVLRLLCWFTGQDYAEKITLLRHQIRQSSKQNDSELVEELLGSIK